MFLSATVNCKRRYVKSTIMHIGSQWYFSHLDSSKWTYNQQRTQQRNQWSYTPRYSYTTFDINLIYMHDGTDVHLSRCYTIRFHQPWSSILDTKESFHLFCFSTGFDQSLLSNIQKLFSEKIEIFSAVEFSKVSILTGIIKITLKVGALIAVIYTRWR